jgi:putative restriction endonuclease
MKYFVGVTDNNWYRYLAGIQPDEVNFWRPSGGVQFRAIPMGAPFLFKLHSPENYVAGGGFFVRYEQLPTSLAWEAFGNKNGAAEPEAFYAAIRHYRRDDAHDPAIGCIILAEPFFFPREQWIPEPRDWKGNIVSGRSYDTAEQVGRALWQAVSGRLAALRGPLGGWGQGREIEDDSPRFSREFLTRARLGQGAFRVLVTGAYNRRCAVTGERTLPVLQAAHIKPVAISGPNRVNNGLLLRSDLHILFDRGYVTVTPDYRVEISPAIREEYENGRDYYALAGQQLAILPEERDDLPDRAYLEWHREEVFIA